MRAHTHTHTHTHTLSGAHMLASFFPRLHLTNCTRVVKSADTEERIHMSKASLWTGNAKEIIRHTTLFFLMGNVCHGEKRLGITSRDKLSELVNLVGLKYKFSDVNSRECPHNRVWRMLGDYPEFSMRRKAALVCCVGRFFGTYWPLSFLYTHTIFLNECLCINSLWNIHISRQPSWQVVFMVFMEVGETLNLTMTCISTRAEITALSGCTLSSLDPHRQECYG